MANSLTPIGMDANGQFRIAQAGDFINGSPVAGGVPALVLGAATGTGATKTIVGNNLAGKITIVTGTTVSVTGILFTLTLADGIVAPNDINFTYTAKNSGATALLTTMTPTTSATGVTVNISGSVLAASTTYIFSYSIAIY